MYQKNNLRLILGAFCIILAVSIAALDFLNVLPRFYKDYNKNQLGETSSQSLDSQSDIDTEICDSDGSICEVDETLQVLRGDTLSSIFLRAEIDVNQTNGVIEQLKKVFNPRELRPEHEIYINYVPLKGGPIKKDLKSVYIRPSIDVEIHVTRDENGDFIATKNKKELKHDVRIVKGTILSSLSIDASKQGVPPRILHEMIQSFAHVVDFQRDFHTGDEYGIVYDTYSDPDSLREASGVLLFATLKLQEKTFKIYRFKPTGGNAGFYNEKGESIKTGLMRTPIDGARISSTFGHRHHPVLGYTKMHKGIDFAAPTGTPIMAAGDGIVVKAEMFGAYGRYVQIRHNAEFSTAYAHMSRFAKGMRAGIRVFQGQIIGYVGSTGRTTGAHLHYEVIRFNKQINPNSVKFLPAAKLLAKDYNHFMTTVHHINKDFESYQMPQPETETSESNQDSTQDVTDDNKPSLSVNVIQ